MHRVPETQHLPAVSVFSLFFFYRVVLRIGSLSPLLSRKHMEQICWLARPHSATSPTQTQKMFRASQRSPLLTLQTESSRSSRLCLHLPKPPPILVLLQWGRDADVCRYDFPKRLHLLPSCVTAGLLYPGRCPSLKSRRRRRFASIIRSKPPTAPASFLFHPTFGTKCPKVLSAY